MGYWKEKMLEDEETGVNFVRELIDGDYLEGAALGVAKLWVDKGDDALTEKQACVLKHYVFDPFVTESCERCHEPIPWSEMLSAHETGYCSWCEHQWEKVLAE